MSTIKMDGKTENDLPCWIPGSELATIIRNEARGSWQRGVAENLIRNGFVVGYRADGSMLKGKAKKYSSHYQESLENYMQRLNDVLPGTLFLEHTGVGSRGAWGYRLVI
jgi:hypothetical protein